MSSNAPSQTSLGQIPTFSTGGKVLDSNICPIQFISDSVLNKSNICVIVEGIFKIPIFKKIS